MTNRYLRSLIVWALILAVAFPVALQLWRRSPREELSYTTFIEQVEAGNVTQVEIGDGIVSGVLKSGQHFTTYVPVGDTSYIELLKAKGVPIRVEPRRSSLWPGLLSTLLPILLLVGFWMLLIRRYTRDEVHSRRSHAPERTIITPPALSPPRGFSHGISVSGGRGLLFLAGQDASGPDGHIVAAGDLVAQVEQVLKNLHAVVETAGGAMQDITKLNIYVRDRRDYLARLKPIGDVFRRYFGKYYPALALFEVMGFFRDDALVEMEGFAVLGSHPREPAQSPRTDR